MSNWPSEVPGPKPCIVALGEVLWDVLPEGPRLGGAPANLCAMAGRLGNDAILASRIGADDLGDRMLDTLSPLPVDTSFLQKDALLPTGTVTVKVTPEGQPSYCIHEGVAWDALQMTHAWKDLAAEADAACFGSVAQRGALSRSTIQDFISYTREDCLRVFDINLRPPFLSKEVVRWSVEHASMLKLNDEELTTVFDLLGFPLPSAKDRHRASLEVLMTAFPLYMICLTLGSEGSLIVSRNGHYRHAGVPTAVIDTVGAGDAFLATVIHCVLHGASLAETSEAANRHASWIASQASAIPETWPPPLFHALDDSSESGR
jgi:fructokinase